MVSNQELLDSSASRDPATGLRAVVALRRLVERLEELQVQNAREQGWSWSDIASHVGVSKQAMHKKYAGRVDAGTDRR
jgi:ribosome-binding protein aMBF1 (putative translation factor)